MPQTYINPVTYYSKLYQKIHRKSSKLCTASTSWSEAQGLKGARFASIPAVIKFHPSQSTPPYHNEYLFSGNLPGWQMQRRRPLILGEISSGKILHSCSWPQMTRFKKYGNICSAMKLLGPRSTRFWCNTKILNQSSCSSRGRNIFTCNVASYLTANKKKGI